MADLRTEWKRVRLSEVAINSTVSTKDHEADGFTRYIIGKHIPEDGGRITSWNPVGDAEFGSRIRTRVRAGDVICTTRGPKLKVAVAEFDCLSAHTNFILRPKDPTALLPGVLEAVVRSDGFQDHLRKHFRGSTNLFVNWSDAAEYEFVLPPTDDQASAVRLLQGFRALSESAAALADAARTLETSFLLSRFGAAIENWMHVELQRAGDLQLGMKKEREYDLCLDPKPFLRVANLGDGELDLREVKNMDFPGHRFERHRLLPGDILLSEGDIVSPWNVGRAAMFQGEIKNCCIQNTLMRFRPFSTVEPEYALAAFRYMRLKGVFVKAAVTTTVTHLVDHRVRLVPFPLPPLETQRAIAAEHDAIVAARRSAVLRALQAASNLRTATNAVLAS